MRFVSIISTVLLSASALLAQSERPPIPEAAHEGDLPGIRKALAGGASIELADESGWNALMIAADRGRLEAAEFLIEKGAKVNAQNKGD